MTQRDLEAVDSEREKARAKELLEAQIAMSSRYLTSCRSELGKLRFRMRVLQLFECDAGSLDLPLIDEITEELNRIERIQVELLPIFVRVSGIQPNQTPGQPAT